MKEGREDENNTSGPLMGRLLQPLLGCSSVLNPQFQCDIGKLQPLCELVI